MVAGPKCCVWFRLMLQLCKFSSLFVSVLFLILLLFHSSFVMIASYLLVSFFLKSLEIPLHRQYGISCIFIPQIYNVMMLSALVQCMVPMRFRQDFDTKNTFSTFPLVCVKKSTLIFNSFSTFDVIPERFRRFFFRTLCLLRCIFIHLVRPIFFTGQNYKHSFTNCKYVVPMTIRSIWIMQSNDKKKTQVLTSLCVYRIYFISHTHKLEKCLHQTEK